MAEQLHANDEPPAPVLRTRILNPCTNLNLASVEVTRIPFSEGGKGCPVWKDEQALFTKKKISREEECGKPPGHTSSSQAHFLDIHRDQITSQKTPDSRTRPWTRGIIQNLWVMDMPSFLPFILRFQVQPVWKKLASSLPRHTRRQRWAVTWSSSFSSAWSQVSWKTR